VSAVEKLGPEPLGKISRRKCLPGLKTLAPAIKVKLLDQSLVAGVGNIYASEALFRAGISPRRAANRLTPAQVKKLWRAIREVLAKRLPAAAPCR
jgi:formamidopyrimidine-DNA glycosylase